MKCSHFLALLIYLLVVVLMADLLYWYGGGSRRGVIHISERFSVLIAINISSQATLQSTVSLFYHSQIPSCFALSDPEIFCYSQNLKFKTNC